MTILVTGINGFIGSAVANHFREKGYDVVGLGRRKTLGKHVNSSCRYLVADITKPLEEIECDYVIHTAGITDDKAVYKEHFLTNVTGTKNVIDATGKAKGFIFISSSSVYSFREKLPYAEFQPVSEINFLSAYGKSKMLAEKILANSCKIPFLILRPRAVYGPGDTVLLPRLAALVRQNKILLPAHITPKISLTHIFNLVEIVSIAIREHKINNQIYNISDQHTYSLKTAILHLLSVQAGLNPNVILIPRLLWEFLVTLNSVVKFNKKITRFGSRQLTNEAVMDISAAKKYFNASLSADLYNT